MWEDRGLQNEIRFAPTQDLSALFVIRCVEQYLKTSGRFGFVMPGAVLTLDHYKDFRTGVYGGQEPVYVRFDRPWDLHRIKPKFFSQHVCVVLGYPSRLHGRWLAAESSTEVWSGRFATLTASRAVAGSAVTRSNAEPSRVWLPTGSAYEPRFHEGATFTPQFAFLLEPDVEGPLGVGIGRRAMRSKRSPYEHEPWAKSRRSPTR